MENLFDDEQDNFFSTQFRTDPNISRVIDVLDSQCTQPVLPTDGKEHVERVTEVPDSICDFVASQLLRQATKSGVPANIDFTMADRKSDTKTNSLEWIHMDPVCIILAFISNI